MVWAWVVSIQFGVGKGNNINSTESEIQPGYSYIPAGLCNKIYSQRNVNPPYTRVQIKRYR